MDASQRETLESVAFWLGVACIAILVSKNQRAMQYLPMLGVVSFGAGVLARYG